MGDGTYWNRSSVLGEIPQYDMEWKKLVVIPVIHHHNFACQKLSEPNILHLENVCGRLGYLDPQHHYYFRLLSVFPSGTADNGAVIHFLSVMSNTSSILDRGLNRLGYVQCKL